MIQQVIRQSNVAIIIFTKWNKEQKKKKHQLVQIYALQQVQNAQCTTNETANLNLETAKDIFDQPWCI